jgi:hypothetical protein
MTDLKISVDRAASFEPSQGEGDAELTLQDGSVGRMSRRLPHFADWADTAARSVEQGAYLYMACEAVTGRVLGLTRAFVLNVDRAEPDPQGGHLRVGFWQRAAVYTLHGAGPGHDARRRLLEQAAASKEEMLVAIDPVELEILDVRPAPQPAEGEPEAR